MVAGPSGVGKSSLLNALSSQSLPAADGMDLSDFACEAEESALGSDDESYPQEAEAAHLGRSAEDTVLHPRDHLEPPKPSEVFHCLGTDRLSWIESNAV